MRTRGTALTALLGLCAGTGTSQAVCFDPKTYVSGYKVPLEEEIRSTKFIVIGKVSDERYLQKDPADPEGITAYIYTISVQRCIKGTLPKTVLLKTENDSGRYPMEVGEQHILFLERQGEYVQADSCGNSSPLPAGNDVVTQVEAFMALLPGLR